MSLTKSNILSTLSSFNTLLNDYPSLLSVTYNDGEDNTSTTISFLLDISKLFGWTEEKLLTWLSQMLTDDEDNVVVKGVLSTIELAVKSALLLYFKSLYTCDIDPLLPDSFLRYAQTNVPPISEGDGVTIPIASIDLFNVLKFYPLGDTGSMFYFDTNYTKEPGLLYRSTDMNAWLWWIINRTTEYNYKNAPWDNRVAYRKKFKGNNGDENRIIFVDTLMKDSPLYGVRGLGATCVKRHIITAKYQENGGTFVSSNVLKVFGCSETYKWTGVEGKNKTVFDFNTDYIYSLKLFDSKTLVAQIINAVMGLGGAMFGQVSLEMNIFIRKVEKTVEKVLSKPVTSKDDSYFDFSEEEYAEIVNDATLRYNGEYDTKNENGDVVKLDTSEITDAIKKIDNAVTSTEKEEAIIYALKTTTKSTAEWNLGINTPYTVSEDIITKFIKELITQISLQILSPKVMILFAINDYFLHNGTSSANINIDAFMKDFWNIMTSCILQVADVILKALWDLVSSLIRPILNLVIEKLLLETIYYYKDILNNLLSSCTPLTLLFGNNKKALVIDNVNYADIIPTQTKPETT